MFVQIFKSFKDDIKACESYKWDTGSFKGCQCLNLINEENFLKLICGNCIYTGNCPCAVKADEQSPWIMSVQIIYDTAQWKKYL